MVKDKWCPEVCPVTFLKFFMWIDHPSGIQVPTYGGPFDSYTIPVPNLTEDFLTRFDVEHYRERYDHDEGAWVEGVETINIRTFDVSDKKDFASADQYR